ncbi:cytochrome P [Marssonina coronariae]|uniref:Cytochrome P n=1 Tax=Diplocarpon coronariae TaxID=2795749 RepID=A0A218Z0N1_9HELO|nr:cytochrome P [Marssonina coronariae]
MAVVNILAFLLHHWPSVLGVVVVAHLARNRRHRGLHRYPGPLLASLTDWWRFWLVYRRSPHVEHIRLHEELGDVVRLGPNCLSFADPKALKDIYGLNKGFIKVCPPPPPPPPQTTPPWDQMPGRERARAGVSAVERDLGAKYARINKQSEFYPVQQSVAAGRRLPSLFSTTSEPFHAQLRRSVNSAFSMSTLIQYEPFVDSTTELFLDQTDALFAAPGAACDFARWLQFYAFDVIGEMTYSKRHGFLEANEDVDGIVSYLAQLFNYVAPVGQMPFLDLLFLKNPIYLLLSRYGVVDATFPVARFAQQRMAERFPTEASAAGLAATEAKARKSQADLLSRFIQAKDERPEFMSDALVMTMAVSMAFAGSETTAISLAAVFYHLLKNPPCLARLYAELDGQAREGRFADHEKGVVTWSESQTLPYLDACIKEAFRMHPAPGLPLERVVPAAGAEIAGHLVPGGTVVGCSAWVIHRNRDVFGEDVDVFRPERWLPDADAERAAEEKRIKEMGSTMLQFGMGSRTCIGKNISLLEIYKVVPSLLRRFEITLEDPAKDWTVHNAWFVRQYGFRTLFKKRALVQPAPAP